MNKSYKLGMVGLLLAIVCQASGVPPKSLFFDETVNKLSPAQVKERVLKSVVTVAHPLAKGKGVIINPNGYILTSANILRNSGGRLSVIHSNNGVVRKYQKIRIMALATQMGLALLKIEDKDATPLPYICFANYKTLQTGDSMLTPSSSSPQQAISSGTVTERCRAMAGFIYIQHSNVISLKNDGSPLFDSAGNLIGINLHSVGNLGGRGIGFAVPVALIKFFITNRVGYAFNQDDPMLGWNYYKVKEKKWEGGKHD